MKFLSLPFTIIFFIVGCSPIVVKHAPIKADDDREGFYIETVHGFADGTRSQVLEAMEREANKLCTSGFILVDEVEHLQQTKHRGDEANFNLIWKVICISG